jgi:hypothetical protein
MCASPQLHSPATGGSGLPPYPQHEVVPDPARLERAAILTDCGLGLTLTG